jgi:hypothetical protein
MNNPWKLATLGLALAGVTAISTGLTTAYVLRPSTDPVAATSEAPPAPAVPAPARVVRAPRAVPAQAVAQPGVVATPAVATRPVAVETVAADCSTGGERAMKIAKPGIIGALAGAGLGAVGGAIADGGKAAGKGALIGGIAGAALGGGYGAYKTKQECGTIFGDSAAGLAGGTLAATSPARPGAGNEIAVFNAR